jgi:signal transduction histidine kinase
VLRLVHMARARGRRFVVLTQHRLYPIGRFADRDHVSSNPPKTPALRLTQGDDDASLAPEAGVVLRANADERLAMMTHELGSLLDGSQRYLNMALRRMMQVASQDDDQAHEVVRHLRAVHAALDRMNSVVGAFSHAAGGHPPMPSVVPREPLADVIEHAIAVIRPAAEERGVRIRSRVRMTLEGIPAGPVYPVVSNALRNAVEACGRDDCIEVEASLEAGRVEIVVRDDGPGVPPDLLERVFEYGVTSKAKGHGVGLALSQDIVDQLGGTIAIVNNPEGGATFRVSYPAPLTAEES